MGAAGATSTRGTGQAGCELPLARVWWLGVHCPRCGAALGAGTGRPLRPHSRSFVLFLF